MQTAGLASRQPRPSEYDVGHPWAFPFTSQLPQERHQVRLLLLGQLHFQDQVEELDRVLQRQQAAVVEVRRATP